MKHNSSDKYLARAELINRPRSCAGDRLPLAHKGMFDILSGFKQGVGCYVDLSKEDDREESD